MLQVRVVKVFFQVAASPLFVFSGKRYMTVLQRDRNKRKLSPHQLRSLRLVSSALSNFASVLMACNMSPQRATLFSGLLGLSGLSVHSCLDPGNRIRHICTMSLGNLLDVAWFDWTCWMCFNRCRCNVSDERRVALFLGCCLQCRHWAG